LVRLPFTMDYFEAVKQCNTINGTLPEFNHEDDYDSFQVHNCRKIVLPNSCKRAISFRIQ